MKRLGLAIAFGVASCGTPELPPHAEVVLEVDTDLSVPRFAGRLRVDTYSENGAWLESRDTALPDARDWPASFSVFSRDEGGATTALVRVRVYAEGQVRDYRGERYQERPAPDPPDEIVALPIPTDEPRLIVDGADRTPRFEPDPALAVDRLLRVRLEPGKRRRARVTLRGACIGTMAHLVARHSCVDTPDVRVPITGAAEKAGGASVVGTFASNIPCTNAPRQLTIGPDGTPLHDDEVCVPGGLFVFGSGDVFGAAEQSALPMRAAVVSPFFLDRHEVTVARYRKARSEGFTPPEFVFQNEGPLATTSKDAQKLCTASSSPLGREQYPLNCISWRSARAFCQFIGADLPTELQWEYAATAASRAADTLFAWGDDAPTCTRAAYGRWDNDATGGVECIHLGFGPRPVNEFADAENDLSPGVGVVGLGGSVTEWVLDSFMPLASRCWLGAPLVDPTCWQEGAVSRSGRGGAWFDKPIFLRAPLRLYYGSNDAGVGIGFRCARPGLK